jgi:predicted Fe-Mo cluster-binding NifX family protein
MKERSMKIAVATEDGKRISAHFGRSPYFSIFEIEAGKTTNHTLRENTFTGHFRGHHGDSPHGEHHHGMGDLHEHQTVAEGLADCNVVISHGMRRKAWEDLRTRGIEMIVTDEIEVEKAVQKYLDGELEDRVEKLH